MEQSHILGLSLESLHELHDGRIMEQLQKHIEAVEQDLVNRPDEKGKREIQLTLQATPKIHQTEISPGVLRSETYGAKIAILLTSKKPKHKAESLDFRLNGGRLVFNKHNARDFNDQSHLPGMYEEDDDDEPAVKMPGA